MSPSAKRLAAVVLAASMWIGAAAAILAKRGSPKFRQTERGHWAAPSPLIAMIAVVSITGAVLYGGSVLERDRHVAFLGHDAGPAVASMIRYGCAGCHVIPGVPGARGQVGPPLDGFAGRLYVGGAAANSPGNLVKWLIDPRAIDPRSAMPATGISEDEAHLVAAYLLGKQTDGRQ